MDSAGKLILEPILETKAATILQFVAGLRGSLLVTFEEGTSAAWLYDLLKAQNDCHVLKGVAATALILGVAFLVTSVSAVLSETLGGAVKHVNCLSSACQRTSNIRCRVADGRCLQTSFRSILCLLRLQFLLYEP